jgi:hypothetical protein
MYNVLSANLTCLPYSVNRLKVGDEKLQNANKAFRGVHDLELDDMTLSWEDIVHILQHFDTVRTLSGSSNGLKRLDYTFSTLPPPAYTYSLTSLSLEYNEFKSLSDLKGLKLMPSLERLSLKGNEISNVIGSDEDMCTNGSQQPFVFTQKLRYIDFSYNAIQSWDFVEALSDVFPGMTALRLSHNPINHTSTTNKTMWSIGEAHMLTVARLGKLTSLNYGTISPTERTEAETYYLSQIAKAMAEVPEHLESTITSQHKRYAELCRIHGAPDVVRKGEQTVNPDFLEARLIKFTFYMPLNTKPGQKETITKDRELPKALDIYSVKGAVGRMFGEKPLNLKLIWETGTMDPVAGSDDIVDDDSDEEPSTESQSHVTGNSGRVQLSRFVQREVEIEDSTRQVGNFVDGMEARVRVELR